MFGDLFGLAHAQQLRMFGAVRSRRPASRPCANTTPRMIATPGRTAAQFLLFAEQEGGNTIA